MESGSRLGHLRGRIVGDQEPELPVYQYTKQQGEQLVRMPVVILVLEIVRDWQ